MPPFYLFIAAPVPLTARYNESGSQKPRSAVAFGFETPIYRAQ
jgi:hypothetical protein